jgi:tripartite-type tricarboxylate transporter receptor subunit TctC
MQHHGKVSRTRRSFLHVAAGLGLTFAGSIAALPAHAQTIEEFYRNKTVRIIVGFAPGGGYDLYARLAAEFLGRFIPGNPTVIVENMPGGGGVRAASYLYTAAPKDGTVLSVVVQSIAFDSVLGELPGNIDAGKFNYIGRLTSNVEVQFTWHTSPTKSLEDAKRNTVAVGATGPSSPSTTVPMMLNDSIGTKFKIVQGYRGTAEAGLAMERGEVEGMMQSLESLQGTRPDWLNEKKINLIWQLGLKRDPRFPDVPAVGELGDTPEEHSMLQLIAGTAEIGRSIIAPPGVPPERVAALRQAFQAMVGNAEFQAAAKSRNTPLESTTGEALQEMVAAAMATPKSVIEKTRSIVATK